MNKHIIAKKPTYFYAPLLYLSISSNYIRINSKLRDEIGFECYMGEHENWSWLPKNRYNVETIQKTPPQGEWY
jgi:hypothetical protein